VFVTHPATVRFLVKQAASGMGSVQQQWTGRMLVAKLKEDAGIEPGALDDESSASLKPED
jgi:hypothetical protein